MRYSAFQIHGGLEFMHDDQFQLIVHDTVNLEDAKHQMLKNFQLQRLSAFSFDNISSRASGCILVVNPQMDLSAAIAFKKEVISKAIPCFLICFWSKDDHPLDLFGPKSYKKLSKLIDVEFFSTQANLSSIWEQGIRPERPYVFEAVMKQDESREQALSQALSLLFTPKSDHYDMSHIDLTVVSHFYCNQSSIQTVSDLIAFYSSFPAHVLDRVHFVLVDDGSPIQYELPKTSLNITVVKIDKDIPWNQAGARNLGMLLAKSDNVIISDLDHMLPVETMQFMINHKPLGKKIYKLWLKDSETGHLHRPHPNVFFLSRARFFRHFGLDEEFAGDYGFEDLRFYRFSRMQGTFFNKLPKKYPMISRENVDRNNSYHTLVRDHSINAVVDAKKRIAMQNFGAMQGHSRSSFNFTWSSVLENRRAVPLQRKVQPFWKLGEVLRGLLPFYD